ncbi:MAG: C1 family peptidase, partial [Planctomycetota bacterium]
FDGGVRYVNVEMGLLKDATRRSLVERGEPVWMGCDVGKMMHRELGLLDAKLFDYAGVYGVEFAHGKADRLRYHQTLMTHAMMFTGVDIDPEDTSETGGQGSGGDSGGPRRWRVENSWGDENGVKGFYTMNDSWFDEHMFEVAIHKDLLPEEVVVASQNEPVVLPPWDPMGSLAAG